MKRAVQVAVVLLVAVGIWVLRAEVMTVDEPSAPGSRTEFVVDARTREDPVLLTEMTQGLISVCRLLVNSELLASTFEPLGDGGYRFSLSPALDEFDVREMRGCLTDTKVQHLLVDVREIEQIPAPPDAVVAGAGR